MFLFSNLSLTHGVAFTAFNISEVTLRVTNIVTVDPVSITQPVPKNLVRFTAKSFFYFVLKTLKLFGTVAKTVDW